MLVLKFNKPSILNFSVDIKSLLYSVIEEIGKEKIRLDISSDIGLSKMYSDIVMRKVISKIGSFPDNDTLYVLCESLLHFLLTISMIPSERKIKIHDSIILDVVIPNVRNLKRYPNKSLIIQIIRNNYELKRINQIYDLQPNEKNIWIISANPIKYRYRNYTLNQGSNLYSFSSLLIDIDIFLKNSGDKSFTFLPS